jgi:hypothetical protein
VIISASTWRKTARLGLSISALWMINPGAAFAQSAGQANPPSQQRSTTGETEMKAAAAVTTKVLAIGSWTAKATPEARTPVMPSEARDTLRLELRGKIDQWFAKSDGSGAVFLMNVTTAAEAHALLEQLPLGKAGMMTFELIPIGPLWPLGLLLREPTK